MTTDSSFDDASGAMPQVDDVTPTAPAARGETASICIVDESPFQPPNNINALLADCQGSGGCGKDCGQCGCSESSQDEGILASLSEVQETVDNLNASLEKAQEGEQKIDPMALPRQENEINVWKELLQLFEEKGAAQNAARLKLIPMLQGVETLNSLAQRFVINRFFRSELLCLPVDTRDYATLLRESNQCGVDEWLSDFGEKLIPLLVLHDLPNTTRPIAHAKVDV